MRVWAALAALLGRLPCSINCFEKSPKQETKVISSLQPPPSQSTLHPFSLFVLLPSFPVCALNTPPSISYQIITWLRCIRLPGPGSASLLISLSLCLQQRHANVALHREIPQRQWQLWLWQTHWMHDDSLHLDSWKEETQCNLCILRFKQYFLCYVLFTATAYCIKAHLYILYMCIPIYL